MKEDEILLFLYNVQRWFISEDKLVRKEDYVTIKLTNKVLEDLTQLMNTSVTTHSPDLVGSISHPHN